MEKGGTGTGWEEPPQYLKVTSINVKNNGCDSVPQVCNKCSAVIPGGRAKPSGGRGRGVTSPQENVSVTSVTVWQGSAPPLTDAG